MFQNERSTWAHRFKYTLQVASNALFILQLMIKAPFELSRKWIEAKCAVWENECFLRNLQSNLLWKLLYLRLESIKYSIASQFFCKGSKQITYLHTLDLLKASFELIRFAKFSWSFASLNAFIFQTLSELYSRFEWTQWFLACFSLLREGMEGALKIS